MTIRLAMINLRLQRMEVGLAAVAGTLFVVWAAAIELRLLSSAIASWDGLLASEGVRLIGAMAYVPFAVGLLGGTPIVAGELESRTAQTAWSLEGSRPRWLARKALPSAVLLGTIMLVLSIETALLEDQRVALGQSAWLDLGLFGPLVLVRAFASFGLGVLLGAAIGRSLPAFALGVVLVVSVSYAVGVAREGWVSAQEATVTDDPTAVYTGWLWQAPDGSYVEDATARAAVPATVDEQDVWLEENGFRLLATGIPLEQAMDWEVYESAIYVALGTISIVGAVLLVSRKRPT